jgi:hypothetical protein
MAKPNKKGTWSKNPIAHGSNARPAKIEIRRNVLDAVGRPARVFDAYAGAGELHAAVWHQADSYTGCDEKWFNDARRMFVADNRRVLRAIDLAAFNIFDLDAYGSPWEQAIIIAARRKIAPGERLGLVITEGLGLSYKLNAPPAAVRLLTGLNAHQVGLNHRLDTVTARCIAGLAQRFGARVIKQWRAAGTTTTDMRYIGLILGHL